ncbi:MAG TPA: cell division protein ZapE [Stellaceae bacterium]|nr:cell division protein ZapE [Stellaceae bacterium]
MLAFDSHNEDDDRPATLDTFPGPLAVFRAKRAAGELKPDPAQELGIQKLQSLHRALLNYRPLPPAPSSAGWFAKLLAVTPPPPPARPKGLYLFGGVGRGKSMLMDVFFAASSVKRKRRVHFHAFMQEVQDRLHRLRDTDTSDPLVAVAHEIAVSAWLLCFDEFVVTDIADAMILGRLFEAMFHAGVIVVATSNRAPDDLYRDGLQRDRFLPFIALFKEELDVLELDNGRDYRLSRLIGRKVYHTPADLKAAIALEQTFAELTDGERATAMTIEVHKRPLRVPRQAHGTAFFHFADLCAQPLGAGDYLAIAEAYENIIIAEVPVLNADNRDQARRFNTLIDTLYEARVHVIISAAAPPEKLYVEGDGALEFERTASRLIEMQSLEYLSARRVPPSPPARLAAAGNSR